MEGEEVLEKLVNEFVEAIEEAKQNPLIIHLDDYKEMIAGNIIDGKLEAAKYHAELLIGYYVRENPYKPEQDGIIAKHKENNPRVYEIFDASRKMWKIGKIAEKILKNL